MVKKQFLRCICFMLCLVMLTVLMCDLFESENINNGTKSMYTYRNLPEDTVDAIFIGTSGVDRYWMAPKAYDEYGIAMYALGFNAFPVWLYTNFMDEVIPKQNPELVLIDVRPFYQNCNDTKVMDARARRYLDSLPLFNLNRIKAAFDTMEIIHAADEEKPSFDASYLLPVIKFHTKWADDYSLYDNLGDKDHLFGSYCMHERLTIKRAPQERVVFKSDAYRELDPRTEQSLYEVIEYINENNITALFVDTPQFVNKNENGRANAVYKILEENNMDYIHFYKPDSDEFTINLDSEGDFYDESHVNYHGAEKFTAVLAKYIDENYDLPDSRENPVAKEFWDGKYDKIKNEIKYFEKLKAEKAKK